MSFWIVVGVLLALAVVYTAWKLAGRRKGSDDSAWRDGPPPSDPRSLGGIQLGVSLLRTVPGQRARICRLVCASARTDLRPTTRSDTRGGTRPGSPSSTCPLRPGGLALESE